MAKQELGWIPFTSTVRVNELLYTVERFDTVKDKMILTPFKSRDSWQPVAPCAIEMNTTDLVERA